MNKKKYDSRGDKYKALYKKQEAKFPKKKVGGIVADERDHSDTLVSPSDSEDVRANKSSMEIMDEAPTKALASTSPCSEVCKLKRVFDFNHYTDAQKTEALDRFTIDLLNAELRIQEKENATVLLKRKDDSKEKFTNYL